MVDQFGVENAGGLPVDGSVFGQTVQPGLKYATAPINSLFAQQTNQVYVTSALQSYPGNSGGPLYVQFTNGTYYPAAVYLGTVGSGSGSQTVVRAIDSEVVNLINLAANQGDAGTNNSGGGVLTIIPSQAINAHSPRLRAIPTGTVGGGGSGGGLVLGGRHQLLQHAQPHAGCDHDNAVVVQFKPIMGWNLLWSNNSSGETFSLLHRKALVARGGEGRLSTIAFSQKKAGFFTVLNPSQVAQYK